MRFAAPNAVVQLRLEGYMESGQKIFDTEIMAMPEVASGAAPACSVGRLFILMFACGISGQTRG